MYNVDFTVLSVVGKKQKANVVYRRVTIKLWSNWICVAEFKIHIGKDGKGL